MEVYRVRAVTQLRNCGVSPVDIILFHKLPGRWFVGGVNDKSGGLSWLELPRKHRVGYSYQHQWTMVKFSLQHTGHDGSCLLILTRTRLSGSITLSYIGQPGLQCEILS